MKQSITQGGPDAMWLESTTRARTETPRMTRAQGDRDEANCKLKGVDLRRHGGSHGHPASRTARRK